MKNSQGFRTKIGEWKLLELLFITKIKMVTDENDRWIIVNCLIMKFPTNNLLTEYAAIKAEKEDREKRYLEGIVYISSNLTNFRLTSVTNRNQITNK